ncbi:MAG: dihydropteroate synthase [Myxococcales bacterium]|nr:dihydropteroate synthase [Myxococcales bacterium]USN50959.1 MAG: dihydropteroate synthase [Myxococcales bacterium]
MLKVDNALIMGVLNVTPDSFSDGGFYLESDRAIARGLEMVEQGADIIDIGAESTSYYTDPQKKPVEILEQIKRAVPVIKGLEKAGVRGISIDTSSAVVAQAALDHGATWINDQRAAMADKMMPVTMKNAERVVLMHGFGLGFGVNAGERVNYSHPINELKDFFQQRVRELLQLGLEKEKIIIDPGFGFGKGLEDSLTILAQLSSLKVLGFPVLIGLSRKSFIGKLCGIEDPMKRDNASLGGNVMALLSGVGVIRTHNVKMLAEAKCLIDATWLRRSR